MYYYSMSSDITDNTLKYYLENTSNEWFEPVDDEHYPKEN